MIEFNQNVVYKLYLVSYDTPITVQVWVTHYLILPQTDNQEAEFDPFSYILCSISDKFSQEYSVQMGQNFCLKVFGIHIQRPICLTKMLVNYYFNQQMIKHAMGNVQGTMFLKYCYLNTTIDDGSNGCPFLTPTNCWPLSGRVKIMSHSLTIIQKERLQSKKLLVGWLIEA